MGNPLLLSGCVGMLLGLLGMTSPACAQTVSVWLTTDDQTKLLQPQAAVTFSAGSAGTNCVFVDDSQLYQPIEGFGADFTDTTGYTLNELAQPLARTNALRNLFSRAGNGIGLSFMRVPMGASDLARWQYSYDDLAAGQTDTNLVYFSIAHDQPDIIPLIQQARQLNPQLKLMANPWSPPGWMKSSGSLIGGSLLPAMYGPFANYFVKFIQAYQAQGIPIDYISLQNEPLYVPSDYPGMSMDASTQLVVLRDYVLPALAANQLSTKVLVYDHNWDAPGYPETVLADATVAASPQVAGIAWHGYGGTPGAMLTLGNEFPQKGNYETEHSGGTWVSDQVRTDFEEIIHVLRSGARSFVKWNLAGDQNDGPHSGGCGTCTPLVTVNSSTGLITYTADYYTLAHFSRFVLPGAYRVYSANASGIVSAAFLNPDSSKVLVAYNDTPASNTFQVQWGGQSFSYTLPAYAGATFTWSGARTGAYTLVPTNAVWVSSFNVVSGLQTEQSADTQGGYDVGYAANGDYALFENVHFATGFSNLTARVASAGGGTLEFHLNSPTGPLAASVAVPNTGGWQTWQTVSGSVYGGSGLHHLYLVTKGGSGIGNFNWFRCDGALPPAPAPWTNTDVGTVGLAGSTAYASGTFTLTGSGDDIWNGADACQFVQQPAGPTCEIRARVTNQQNSDPWAKAGVMLRESSAAGAINAAVVVTPANGVAFQVRTATGANTLSTVLGGVSAPCWVRLARTATNSFAGYYSLNGTTWTQIGSTARFTMSANALAGLAVTAHNNATNCIAVFDSVSLNQAPSLAPVANQALVAGRVLSLTNTASDPDVPAQTLSFKLLNAPAGAGLDANTGVFTWRPTIAQAPSVQTVSFAVSDNGVPSMSTTQSFAVTVSAPATPVLGMPSLTNGHWAFWLQGDAGPDYTIQVSTNLTAWLPLSTVTPAALPWLWVDTNTAAVPARFYRVVLGP